MSMFCVGLLTGRDEALREYEPKIEALREENRRLNRMLDDMRKTHIRLNIEELPEVAIVKATLAMYDPMARADEIIQYDHAFTPSVFMFSEKAERHIANEVAERLFKFANDRGLVFRKR